MLPSRLLGFSRSVSILLTFVLLDECITEQCLSQLSTTFDGSGITDDWFEDANWTFGVPNAPGDQATISNDVVAVDLTADATIGELSLRGSMEISGVGTLFFELPNGEARIRSLKDSIIRIPIALPTSDSFAIAIARDTETRFENSLSGTELLKTTGPGIVTLASGNPNLFSAVEIQLGRLQLAHGQALASASEVTVSGSGALVLAAVDPHVLSKVNLDGGAIQSSISRGVDLDADIEVLSDSVIGGQNSFRTNLDFNGDIGGSGGLQFVHSGTTSQYDSFDIFGDSTYLGTTEVGVGAYVQFRKSGALPNSNIHIDGGTLELEGGGTGPMAQVLAGNLLFNGAVDSYDRPTTLGPKG